MIDWDAQVLAPNEAVFGEPVTYIPAIGADFAILGVFDEAWREVELLDTELGNTSVTPVLGVRLNQFPNPPQQNDQVRIARVNSTYRVREVRPDGHGGAKLLLNFQANTHKAKP